MEIYGNSQAFLTSGVSYLSHVLVSYTHGCELGFHLILLLLVYSYHQNVMFCFKLKQKITLVTQANCKDSKV